ATSVSSCAVLVDGFPVRIFFLLWSAIHRVLHSFPTRRSSDLGRAHLETVAARKRIRGKGLRLLLESPDHIGIQYQVIPISHVPNVERTKSRHIRDMRYRAPPVDTRLLVDISHLPAEIIDFPVDGKRRKNLVVPQDVREHPLYTAGYTRAVTATHGHAHAAIGEVVKLEIGPIGYGGDLLLVYAAKEVEIGQ